MNDPPLRAGRTDDTFLRAHDIAREQAGEQWNTMSVSAQTEAIYEVMRTLDAQRAGVEPRPYSRVSTSTRRPSSEDQEREQ